MAQATVHTISPSTESKGPDYEFRPSGPVKNLTVTAAALEAARLSEQAHLLDEAQFKYRDGHDVHRLYGRQRLLSQRRADAMKDAALMLPAADAFEALMQTVYLHGEIDGLAETSTPEHFRHEAEKRIGFALQSIMRVLENISGESRLKAGSFYQRFDDHRPHMDAVPAADVGARS